MFEVNAQVEHQQKGLSIGGTSYAGMMVRALCRRGGSVAGVWQGPVKLLRAPAATSQKSALSPSSIKQSSFQWPVQKGLSKGGVSCGHHFSSAKSFAGSRSTSSGAMETTNALSANELRRSVTEGNSAGRPRETNHGFANIFEGRQLGGVNIARRFQVNGPSSLGQTSKVGRVAGLQTSSSLKQSETAPSLVLDSVAGAVDSEGGRQIGRPSAKDAETSSALNEATSSEVADPPPLRMINTGLKTAAPLPDQDTASHLENAPKQQLESRRSHTLTKRILRGAIELKAVVFSSSPLAKTKESKKELAEQRAKKRKEGTVVFATGKTSGLDSVTEKEVAESLEKLERGAFAELRIVNEDAFKEHMAFLRDPEQKQRVSTYRTLAGRILSEYLTLSETQNSSAQASKPSANQSQTLSFNPSEQSRAPSNEAAKPSDQQSPIAQNQTEIPPEPLLTPSNQGPKPTVQCTECWLPQESCMCREVFRLSRPLWPGMRVWMLMHSKEYRRKNNTGKVMWQLFGEESVRLSISGLDILEDEMWKEFAAAGPGRVFLMYPERKAQETMEVRVAALIADFPSLSRFVYSVSASLRMIFISEL